MQKYLALFRGINVSGKNIIKMEGLRKVMANAGYTDVVTYIQSGNVVFTANEADKGKVRQHLEALVQKEYNLSITIFILDENDMQRAISGNPFAGPDDIEEGTKKLYITFLSGIPEADYYEKLLQAPIGEDEIALKDAILYFKLAGKASESKLSNNLIENKLKLRATTRNWNTTIKLYGMLKET
ncbi:DUF1697 domain-containing protein [Flavobacterium sp.]|uniref:DUF1697 domain-containing protein n=1 Tax=Flavobacterium sp. TaxID=239 RepID=UPI00261FCC2C|nr:DUF1697 domain-containing protein [Flavobacterium sp.]